MVNPEKIADVDEGAQSDLDIGGMNAEEQATWDAMRAGRDLPTEGGTDAENGADRSDDGGGDDSDGDGTDTAADPAHDVDQTAQAEKRVAKTVSFHKHQRKLKEAEDKAAALQAKLDGAMQETAKEREQRTRLDERTKMLLDAISAKPKPATEKPATETDPEPDGEDDPIAHAAWTARELKRTQQTIKAIQEGTQKRETESAAEREQRTIYDTYENDLKREAMADPNFPQAFVALRESRYTELGYIYTQQYADGGIDINDKAAVDATLTPEQQVRLSQDIQRSFHDEQMLVAREALSKGRSPAKAVLSLARARGWKPEAAAVVPAKASGNGAAAPARQVAAKPTVSEELAAIREGQANSKSLSDAGGSPGGDITPERLATMTDDEFDEFYNSMPKNKLDKLMGKTLQ